MGPDSSTIEPESIRARCCGLSHRLHALAERRRLVHFVLRDDAIGLIRRGSLIAGWRIGQADPRRLAGEGPVVFLLEPVHVEEAVFLLAKLGRQTLFAPAGSSDG